MNGELKDMISRIENLALELGLEYYPVDFEVVPPSFMMEIAVYGLPVRMPHWSFGVRWIYQMVQHRMGHSRIFEVVFPGNPNRAYLVNNNTLEENTLVAAHVLGHADFSYNNLLIARSQQQTGYHIVEQAAAHARRIQDAVAEAGQARVEAVLDAALALEQHIASRFPINRPSYAPDPEPEAAPERGPFQPRFSSLPGENPAPGKLRRRPQPLKIPPRPEADLLWFCARYAPEMEDWERDVFLAVREESYYFQPIFNCQVMNEGWASYWHARILREADFLPDALYLDAMKTHSDVVRPHAGDHQVALAINPYHLGFVMWDYIVREHGLDEARTIMREEDDFGFIRNHLSAELAQELKLFVYSARRNGEVRVTDANVHDLHETLLAPKYNFGAPHVVVQELRNDGTLVLKHEVRSDGRGLQLERSRRVLEYIHRVWRRPVVLHTIDAAGEPERLQVGMA